MENESTARVLRQTFHESWDHVEQAYRRWLTALPSHDQIQAILLHMGEPPIAQANRAKFGPQQTRTWVQAVLAIIRALRAAGYADHLRAGQSMEVLMLSRSIQYGLRPEQAYVAIEPRQVGGMTLVYQTPDHTERIVVDHVGMCEALEQMLSNLRAHPLT